MSADQPHEEFSLIDWIDRQSRVHPQVVGPQLLLGIGDDAAVLQIEPDRHRLATVDTLMEGVHFTMPPASPRQVGHKSLAVNLSDIAAMAGRPRAALVSLVLPRENGITLAQEVHAGIQSLAAAHDVVIAGGDTNTWNGPLVVSLTLLGDIKSHRVVRRDGAQAGDWIMVTGTLGGSGGGKHLDFQPRVPEALALNQQVSLHAMIDISDGMAADLHHLLSQSGVGAVVDAVSIPISRAAGNCDDGQTPLAHALCDGEDFELLFTVSPADGRKLLEQPPFATRLSKIGDVTAAAGCQLRTTTGHLEALPPRGWQHGFLGGAAFEEA